MPQDWKNKSINSLNAIIILIGVSFFTSIIIITLGRSYFWGLTDSTNNQNYRNPPINRQVIPTSKENKIIKFASDEDFKKYITNAQNMTDFYGRIDFTSADVMVERAMPMVELSTGGETASPKTATTPSRISTTNVQVIGIDEPDIVKTDGKKIYFSSDFPYKIRSQSQPMTTPFVESKIAPPYYRPYGETKIINAFPPEDLTEDSNIDKSGTLLLDNKILLVFGNDNKIYGYDVSDSKKPIEKWKLTLEERTSLVTARLYKGKVYTITRTGINYKEPCPIIPLQFNDAPIRIPCTEIYHPIAQIPADITYYASIIDPINGKIENNISFIGSSNDSVVYMSNQALYITYSYQGDIVTYFYNFLQEKGKDLVADWVLQQLKKLASYELNESTKISEMGVILNKYYNSLTQDEKTKIENELNNRMNDYAKAHLRELENTSIIKIGLDEFKILANGTIPGNLLNQFSLDEYNGYLRTATTIGERLRWWGWDFGANTQNANDIYVLDANLKIVGMVKDMGLTERIYSARFIEDRGYLVTFRQTDPFYVLDLSSPINPQLKGELKIPGYSSYLHPIAKNKILGIGQEGSQVKISLFDISDPQNPKETSKYLLKEYWTEVNNNFHAFLLDDKHNIFFLPAGQGGYIFSYTNDNIQLKRAVSGIYARRAIYLDDYLYVIGNEKIVVINENNWENIKELSF